MTAAEAWWSRRGELSSQSGDRVLAGGAASLEARNVATLNDLQDGLSLAVALLAAYHRF